MASPSYQLQTPLDDEIPASSFPLVAEGANVHVYPSDFRAETRLLKITAFIAARRFFTNVSVIGLTHSGRAETKMAEQNVELVCLPYKYFASKSALLTKLVARLDWCLGVWRHLRGKKIACINCHSLPLLPLCVALKWRHRAILVYDAHELETETCVSIGIRKWIGKLAERILINFVDRTVVVGDFIADWYAEHYRIERPLVVRNISEHLTEAGASPTVSLRKTFGISPDRLIFIYVGNIEGSRGIQRLLDIFSDPDMPHALVLMGGGSLKEKIAHAPGYGTRIFYKPAVPHREVVSSIADADVGLILIDVTCLSYKYCLPNKFFEYLAAGLPVMINSLEEISSIIMPADAGWRTRDDAESIRSTIIHITPEEVQRKRQNAKALSYRFSWAEEAAKLERFYRALRKAA